MLRVGGVMLGGLQCEGPRGGGLYMRGILWPGPEGRPEQQLCDVVLVLA